MICCIKSYNILLLVVIFQLLLLNYKINGYLPIKSYKSINNQLIRSFNKLYSTTITNDYDAGAITVLQGLEPVRKRPGMYIGSTSQRGLHHLVYEVVDNAVDESLAGHCNNITLIFNDDGSVCVEDNGRGIPCSIHPVTGKSALETVLCVLHAGGKFGGEDSGYKVSGGLHGVGISVVNALSESMKVEVVRDNNYHVLTLAKGFPQTDLLVTPLTSTDVSMSRGTRVTFKPDPTIFKSTLEFDYDKIASRIDELAYLNPGLTITMIDKRTNSKYVSNELNYNSDGDEIKAVAKENRSGYKKEVFRHDGGIGELVEHLCDDKINLHPDVSVININGEKKGITVDIAMRWSKDMYNDNLIGFANGIKTIDGGSHLDGLKASITKTINSLGKKYNKIKENIPGEYLREGLTAVISVKVPEPEFEGQTKTRLGNPEVRTIVDTIVTDSLNTIFEWNQPLLQSICSKSLDALTAALAAKAARDIVRRKSLLTSTVLPGKLADCSSRNPAECEIYLVEGDSAAGSAKQGRDRRTQAILPLRGKIINIDKATNEKIYQNQEISSMIAALGLGLRGVEFDAEQLRYHRIVIMTDADVDGAHIRLLLLTFFYRYQRELITKGFIYIACPPLYKLSYKAKNNVDRYFYDQEELDLFLSTNPTTNYSLQRFKGLGEMMPTQLWETTMDPAKRILKRVDIEDAVIAEKLLTILMSDNVLPRKEFIISNSEKFKYEDLDF